MSSAKIQPLPLNPLRPITHSNIKRTPSTWCGRRSFARSGSTTTWILLQYKVSNLFFTHYKLTNTYFSLNTSWGSNKTIEPGLIAHKGVVRLVFKNCLALSLNGGVNPLGFLAAARCGLFVTLAASAMATFFRVSSNPIKKNMPDRYSSASTLKFNLISLFPSLIVLPWKIQTTLFLIFTSWLHSWWSSKFPSTYISMEH